MNNFFFVSSSKTGLTGMIRLERILRDFFDFESIFVYTKPANYEEERLGIEEASDKSKAIDCSEIVSVDVTLNKLEKILFSSHIKGYAEYKTLLKQGLKGLSLSRKLLEDYTPDIVFIYASGTYAIESFIGKEAARKRIPVLCPAIVREEMNPSKTWYAHMLRFSQFDNVTGYEVLNRLFKSNYHLCENGERRYRMEFPAMLARKRLGILQENLWVDGTVPYVTEKSVSYEDEYNFLIENKKYINSISYTMSVDEMLLRKAYSDTEKRHRGLSDKVLFEEKKVLFVLSSFAESKILGFGYLNKNFVVDEYRKIINILKNKYDKVIVALHPRQIEEDYLELVCTNVIITRKPYYELLPLVDAVVTYKKSSVDGVTNYTSLSHLSLQDENFMHCKGLDENDLDKIEKKIDDMRLQHTENTFVNPDNKTDYIDIVKKYVIPKSAIYI